MVYVFFSVLSMSRSLTSRCPSLLFQVFFSVIIGSFSLGNALPEIQTFATALGSATIVFKVIDRVSHQDLVWFLVLSEKSIVQNYVLAYTMCINMHVYIASKVSTLVTRYTQAHYASRGFRGACVTKDYGFARVGYTPRMHTGLTNFSQIRLS